MSTILERLQYGFDRDSRRTWRRRTLATGEDNAYSYDGLSQVTQAALGNLNQNASAISATPAQAEAWDYDPTGNWRGYHVETDGSVSLDQHRVHDKGNRLTQIEDDPSPVLLDRAGRIRQVSPNASGNWNESQQMKWDAWGRVTQVNRTSDGAVLGSYAYDGLTRRTTRTVGGSTSHCYYSDKWRPLEEREDEETTAALHYYWGARHRDDLARRDRATTDGGELDEIRYALMDYFSPATITDQVGIVKERYAFNAFGIRRVLTPDFTPRSDSECAFKFAFQGQLLDTESGFLDYGYRYYSPRLGRWLAKDLINTKESYNLYIFVANKSTNNVDYVGLLSEGDYNQVGFAAAQKAYEYTSQGAYQHYTKPEWCGIICNCQNEKCTTDRTYASEPHEGSVKMTERGGWVGTCNPLAYFGSVTCPDKCDYAGSYHAHPSGDIKPSGSDYVFPAPPGTGQFIGGGGGTVSFHIVGNKGQWFPLENPGSPSYYFWLTKTGAKRTGMVF